MDNVATAFCATLVDEWVRGGLRWAFIAPGSRSTPLALALVARDELRCEVVLDERSAAFMALGCGLATGRPALVLTTSGTAVTHLHAAVVEAGLSEVPLIVCTADRPPELHGVGAAQTIDQYRVFGSAVRAFLDLGVPDAHNRTAWRSLASRAIAEATGSPAGPVQVNLGFREPLVGAPGPLPPGRPDGRPWHRRIEPAASPDGLAADLLSAWRGRRGVFVAGAGIDEPAHLLALADELGWPVLADPRSGSRTGHDAVVAHADAVLRVEEWARRLRPEVVVQAGAPPASKVLATWIASISAPPADADAGGERPEPAEVIVVNRSGSWWDPDRRASLVVACEPSLLARAMGGAAGAAAGPDADGAGSRRIDVDSPQSVSGAATRPAGWAELWRRADDAAAAALSGVFEAGPPSERPDEPTVARAAWDASRRHRAGALVVSSSMPVRDLEWYATRAPLGERPLRVLANRGANGIDGVVSTAVGAAVALAPEPVWVLIGDLAFLHDGTALLDLARREMSLRLVVVDNRGGGIFSFLPQAGTVDPTTFERLFGTTQEVDVADVLRIHGIPTTEVDRTDGLAAGFDALVHASSPIAALVVRVAERSANVAVHDRLHAAVAAELGRLQP